MAKVFIEESTLTAIGDAIRGKTGKTELIDPANMHTEIASIEAGGGGYEPPEEALNITGAINYRFMHGHWDWFMRDFGDRMTTTDITDLAYAFAYTKVTSLPFQINIKDLFKAGSCFFNTSLRTCPKIRGNIIYKSGTDLELITECGWLEDVEDLFTPEMLEGFQDFKVTSGYSAITPTQFESCNRLRRIPSWWYKFKLNPASTTYPAATYSLYNTCFKSCYSLDEIRDIPVWKCAGKQTSNMFNNAVQNTKRIKAFTFEINPDGSPITTEWKAQVIDLTTSGNFDYEYEATAYASMPSDKKVTDDASYQALKDDPDWWTIGTIYSRYNHDSAVETINSLPDTSAYLATAGGTNTIKFKGAAGALTDGGAINTLTEAEIAVAAAKGWTVTLV